MQDENRCLSTHFWHIRGKRCVPLKCKHGRNSNSGVCLKISKKSKSIVEDDEWNDDNDSVGLFDVILHIFKQNCVQFYL
jgi:hypothetical protein